MKRFEEVVRAPGELMGVKAVFGVLTGRAVCFGSRGNAALKDRGHFQSARATAEYAIDRPLLITIGGGQEVPAELMGRVLNVARVSKIYGETNAFYVDPEDRQRLAQWPVAVGLLDVYAVEGYPHLVNDLGLPDRTILANAFDLVVRPQEKTEALWKALAGYTLRLLDLPALPNFREPNTVKQVGTMLPKSVTKEEGHLVSKEVQAFERNSYIAKEARRLNRERHSGVLSCEACSFRDSADGMFDVHHLVPLMLGARETTLSDVAVLCPLCHRWAHRKGTASWDPLPMSELRAARAT